MVLEVSATSFRPHCPKCAQIGRCVMTSCSPLTNGTLGVQPWHGVSGREMTNTISLSFHVLCIHSECPTCKEASGKSLEPLCPLISPLATWRKLPQPPGCLAGWAPSTFLSVVSRYSHLPNWWRWSLCNKHKVLQCNQTWQWVSLTSLPPVIMPGPVVSREWYWAVLQHDLNVSSSESELHASFSLYRFLVSYKFSFMSHWIIIQQCSI